MRPKPYVSNNDVDLVQDSPFNLQRVDENFVLLKGFA
jgi:hypothetical protein